MTKWTTQEDQYIFDIYNQANGAFPTYKQQAAQINASFHNGEPIRNAQQVRRREGKLLKTKKLDC